MSAFSFASSNGYTLSDIMYVIGVAVSKIAMNSCFGVPTAILIVGLNKVLNTKINKIEMVLYHHIYKF
jgi:hypothetical protein